MIETRKNLQDLKKHDLRGVTMAYQERFYREQHKSADLVTYQVMIEESDLMVSSDMNIKKELLPVLKGCRDRIENACSSIDGFEKSLKPIQYVTDDAMIQQMINASQKAKVGPMAAVAGMVSECVAKEAVRQGWAKEIIVENGGDLYMDSARDRKILIYAGESPFSNRIGLHIKHQQMPLGICTSAGTVGHSLSLGKADAVVVLSKDTALADAMATSIGNLVQIPEDIQKGIDFGKQVDGILGILIIIQDKMGAWGDVEIFKA